MELYGGKVMLLVFNYAFFIFNLLVLILTVRKALKIKRKRDTIYRSNNLRWR